MPSDASDFAQPQLFHCPTCGASLPVPETPSIRCEYCGNLVLVPREYLKPERPQVQVEIHTLADSAESSAARRGASQRFPMMWIWLLGVGIFASLMVGLFAAGGGIFAAATLGGASSKLVEAAVTRQSEAPNVIPIAMPSPTPLPFASLALRFGGEGTGAGQFEDSRHIAIDLEGNIYVGEYQAGRVQKFDSQGKFIWMITIPEDRNGYTVIRDIAVDTRNRLYVVRTPDILVFNTGDGAPAGEIKGKFPDTMYDALAIDPTNSITALHLAASGNDLLKLDAQGQLIYRQEDYLEKIERNLSSSGERVAVDGLGQAYLINQIGAQVYLYDAQGNYLDRFGSKGDGPGQLDHPMGITVGGDGRIYVIDTGSIDVFDQDGMFQDALDWDYTNGSPFDIAVDAANNLYLITNQGWVMIFSQN